MTETDAQHNARVLHALADFLLKNPQIEMPDLDSWERVNLIRFQLTSHGDRAAAAAAETAKAFPGAFRKDYNDAYFNLSGEFEGVRVEIRTLREDVCVAREVGTRTVQVPDPEALALVPKLDLEVPVFEYDCKPILAEVSA
jgi:hypothetical protein